MDRETYFFASQIFPSFTVLFHDNMVIFCENTHHRHFMICECKRDIGYLLWDQNFIPVPLSLMCYMRYHVLLDSVLMELDFMSWRLLLVNHLLVSKFFISWCPSHDQNCNQISNSTYCQTSNIRCTESQNLNVSRLLLQLTLPNPLKPGVKSRMKM